MSSSPTVPAIYSLPPVVQRLGFGGRAIALAVAGACLTVLIVAASLDPSPRGYGSHTAMGFPECAFLLSSGLPCPSCGMTTSFAWFVRGHLLASLWVQPGGTLLAIACCAVFWGALYIGITGKPVYRLLRDWPVHYYVLVPLLLGVAAWAWKIFVHLRGIDGWTS